MKKMILGLTLMVMGFLSTIGLLITATAISPKNPWNYYGIEGWYGCVLGMHLVIPMVITMMIGIIGAVISVKEAYK